MNNRKALITLLSAFLVVLALPWVLDAQDESAAPATSTSTVHRFVDGSEVEGTFSRLTRYENGVTAALSTSDLAPNEVYTVWWVVFNAPENCSGGVCNEDDIFVVEDGQIVRTEDGNRAMNMDGIQAANISVQHASGSYTEDGRLYISASLGEGEVPGIVFGPGLLDAETAEVHMVVRTHGARVDEIFADQISSFGGGCEPIDAAPCDDIQFTIHQAEAE